MFRFDLKWISFKEALKELVYLCAKKIIYVVDTLLCFYCVLSSYYNILFRLTLVSQVVFLFYPLLSHQCNYNYFLTQNDFNNYERFQLVKSCDELKYVCDFLYTNRSIFDIDRNMTLYLPAVNNVTTCESYYDSLEICEKESHVFYLCLTFTMIGMIISYVYYVINSRKELLFESFRYEAYERKNFLPGKVINLKFPLTTNKFLMALVEQETDRREADGTDASLTIGLNLRDTSKSSQERSSINKIPQFKTYENLNHHDYSNHSNSSSNHSNLNEPFLQAADVESESDLQNQDGTSAQQIGAVSPEKMKDKVVCYLLEHYDSILFLIYMPLGTVGMSAMTIISYNALGETCSQNLYEPTFATWKYELSSLLLLWLPMYFFGVSSLCRIAAMFYFMWKKTLNDHYKSGSQIFKMVSFILVVCLYMIWQGVSYKLILGIYNRYYFCTNDSICVVDKQ